MAVARISALCALLLLLVVPAAHTATQAHGADVGAPSWSNLEALMVSLVEEGAFPGVVGLVADRSGILWAQAAGNFTYGLPPPFNAANVAMQVDTLFDMASLTKVTTTTTAIAQFYTRGELALEEPIASFLGAGYAVNGKGPITVLNCLLHNSGYPPDPSPLYYDPVFDCPQTANYHPALSFSCQQKVFASLLNQSLATPVGAQYVYSDLSMITLMYVVGNLARSLGYVRSSDLIPGCDQGTAASDQCYYEAYARLYIFEELGMLNTGFLPAPSAYQLCAPTSNDTTYRHQVAQGTVNDGNSYAMGGIAGHAGLFTNVLDVHTLMNAIMFTPSAVGLSEATVALFIKEYNNTQSSRALGWDTNDPTSNDEGDNCTCATLSSTTFMHTGYTGTLICADPVRHLIALFFTNRVYPVVTNEKILHARQLFNSLVQKTYDAITGFVGAEAFNPYCPAVTK